MNIIDISRPLSRSIAVWPGDAAFEMRRTAQRSRGDSVNLTSLRLSAHTGTHVDAPFHFSDEGDTLEHIPLHVYWGPAQVIHILRGSGPLRATDLEHVDLTRAPRLLIRTLGSDLPADRFPDDIVYPDPSLAKSLSDAGIFLLGTDAPSMDPLDSTELPGHRALGANGIAILENLSLSDVAEGVYELVALPLRVVGGDGSPVRAALRELER